MNYQTPSQARGFVRTYPTASKKNYFRKFRRYGSKMYSKLQSGRRYMRQAGVALATATSTAMRNKFKRRSHTEQMKSKFDCKREIPELYENKKFYLTFRGTTELSGIAAIDDYTILFDRRIDDITEFISNDPILASTPSPERYELIKGWSVIVRNYKKYTVIGATVTLDLPIVKYIGNNVDASSTLRSEIYHLMDTKPRDRKTELEKPLSVVANCNKKIPTIVPLYCSNPTARKVSCKYSIRSVQDVWKTEYLKEMSRETNVISSPATSRQIYAYYVKYRPFNYLGLSTLSRSSVPAVQYTIRWTIIARDRRDTPIQFPPCPPCP